MARHFCFFSVFLFSTLLFPQPGTKKVSVTFDDLPLNIALRISNAEMKGIVEKLVAEIKCQKIPVTAFVNENKLEVNNLRDSERVEILRIWLDAGIELGNHTYSHKNANDVPIDEFKEEILKGEKTVKELMNDRKKKLRYFRHPYLHTGLTLEYKNEVERFLKERGYAIAPVTIDNSEWVFAKAYDEAFSSDDRAMMEKISLEYITYMRDQVRYFELQSQKLFDRQINQILLIHSNRINSDYLGELLNMLRDEGYEFISLEDALKDEAYNSADTFIEDNGISWLHRWAYTRGVKKDFFGTEPQVPEYILKIAGIQNGY